MTKMLLYFMMLLLLGGVVYYALSNPKEAGIAKDTINQMTDETAQKVVDKIRIPIEKARDLKNRQEKRIRKMEEALKKSLD